MTTTPLRRPRTSKGPVATTLQELAVGFPVYKPTPVVAVPSRPEPEPDQEVPVSPEPQVAEIAQVTTRYTHPVYIASQHKLVHPGEICPVIVDGWVRHQLEHQQGSLIKA